MPLPGDRAPLGCDPFPAYDILELFAFVRPARFAAPTPRGLAVALGLPQPDDAETAALVLRRAAGQLLIELAARGAARDPDAAAIAWAMARGGWRWGPEVLGALGLASGDTQPDRRAAGLKVWERLPEWREEGPEAAPGSAPVEPAEARTRLAALLDPESEARPQQADYASAAALAFRPRDQKDAPNLVLAEAGTGVGKTLGYLAPASLWAETQRRAGLDLDLYPQPAAPDRRRTRPAVYPRPDRKAEQVVIRKGRENYLCLLNLEEAVRGPGGPARGHGGASA